MKTTFNITLISDTHNQHTNLDDYLKGGDMIIHSGDVSSSGKEREIRKFLGWFESLDYTHKIFIAGNHDFYFQYHNSAIVDEYEGITYLQDSGISIPTPFGKELKIWGSPWQPTFNNWAFNLPRLSDELKSKWDSIPTDTDILITHGPPYQILDYVIPQSINVGCERLAAKVYELKPIIHLFGHIHESFGHKFLGGTHFFNASMVTNSYIQNRVPIYLGLDENNNIEFLS